MKIGTDNSRADRRRHGWDARVTKAHSCNTGVSPELAAQADVTKARSSFRLDELRAGIKPFRLHWFSRLRSTNDHAAALRKRGELYAPAVVLTGRQVAGRGRGAHVWWSTGGCLTLTFVFPIHDHHQPHHIPLLAGLATRNAAAEITGDDAIQLKWPNDILHHGRKIAGLLCERVLKADLVGIGLNVNVDRAQAPAEIRNSLTSLAEITGRPLDLTLVTCVLARHLQAMLGQHPQHPIAHLLKQYDEQHALIGRRVTILDAGEPALNGVCQGLDSVGRLLLRDGKTLHRVISGQVVMQASRLQKTDNLAASA